MHSSTNEIKRFVVRDLLSGFVVRRDWDFAKSGMAAFFPYVTAPSDHYTPMTTQPYFGKVPVPSDNKSRQQISTTNLPGSASV